MISTSRQHWSRLSVPFCLSLSLFLKDSNYADPLIKLCHSEFFSPSVFVDLNLHCMNVRLWLCLRGLCNINHFLHVYHLTASFILPLVLRNGLVSENISNENIVFLVVMKLKTLEMSCLETSRNVFCEVLLIFWSIDTQYPVNMFNSIMYDIW